MLVPRLAHLRLARAGLPWTMSADVRSVRPRSGRAGARMTAPMSRADAIATLTAAGQPFELETLEVDGRTVRAFKHAPASLRAMYELYRSDLPFLVYEQERFTFAEAWRAASRIGHALVRDCGVGAGDRVAFAMRNYPEWFLGFNAIESIGGGAGADDSH